MRLAIVSPFVDRRHGTERALAELLERLARDYHCEIHLYSQRVEELVVSNSSLHGARQGGITWHKVPAIPGPHVLQFLFWIVLNTLCRTWGRISGLRFDLVFSPGINCFDANVVVVHALFHRLRELAGEQAQASGQPGFFRRIHRRAYYSLLTWLERMVYSDPHVSLAAVSSRTASLLKGYFRRSDVRVISNGVDAEYFCPGRRLALRAGVRERFKFQETDFVLLLIGNDWGNKGLSTVLDAMAASRQVPLRLLVAGQDAASSFFFEVAKRLDLIDHCRWEMMEVDAISLYSAADAYVSPSHEDAFALPPLEAMACGLPVITSLNNGGSQIITDGVDGFVLKDPSDSLVLTGHLQNLQEHPALRRQIGENARRTAEAYTWEQNAGAIWQFLNEVASEKQA